jgi:putative DNA primase/helicase
MIAEQTKKTANATSGLPTLYTKIIPENERLYIEKLRWRLHPLWPRDKKPFVPDWPNKATNDLARYRAMCGRKAHNIGLATGEGSGVWVLDVDPDHDGAETLRKLIDKHGELPQTVIAKTQSGGRHFYFKYDPAHPLRNYVGKLPGIDVRSSGANVVLPPSIGPSGKQYEWIYDPFTTEVAEAPAWLYDVLESDKQGARKDLSHLAQGVTEGMRNVSITQLVGTLLGRRVDAALTWTLVQAYNQCCVDPPLEYDELKRTFLSIVARERRKHAGKEVNAQ